MLLLNKLLTGPRLSLTGALVSVWQELSLGQAARRRLPKTGLDLPQLCLHFLERVCRRVSRCRSRHCGTSLEARRGSLLLLLLLLSSLLLLVRSPAWPAASRRVSAHWANPPSQPPPPSYCREKLLIALLCRGSTEAERLLGRGVNLGVLGVRGIESRGWMEETTREQLSLTISVERG